MLASVRKTRLALNSEIHLPLLGLKACITTTTQLLLLLFKNKIILLQKLSIVYDQGVEGAWGEYVGQG